MKRGGRTKLEILRDSSIDDVAIYRKRIFPLFRCPRSGGIVSGPMTRGEQHGAVVGERRPRFRNGETYLLDFVRIHPENERAAFDLGDNRIQELVALVAEKGASKMRLEVTFPLVAEISQCPPDQAGRVTQGSTRPGSNLLESNAR